MTSRGPARPSCGLHSPPLADRSLPCRLLMCRCDALLLRVGHGTRHILRRQMSSASMRYPIRKVLVGILGLFLLPLAVHAALYAGKDRPASFRDADWSSVGMLPAADADPEARFLVFTGRTGRRKGIFAVHRWAVLTPETVRSWG